MSFDRAVVVGGSIAGLLAAAALRESFRRVVIVEKDDLPDGPEHRRGVPQGTQVHALLGAGQQAIEDLLPGIAERFLHAGGVLVDSPADIAVYTRYGWSGRVPSDARVICMRRPHLEWVIRRRVLAMPNIDVVLGSVDGLLVRAPGTVAGVRLRDGTTIAADLVVDASGRRSRSPAWLAALGYDEPAEQELRSFIGYATVPVKLPPDALPDGVVGILSAPHPGNLHGAAVVPCDGGLHLVAGLGMMHAYPPTDRDGFLAHLDSAPTPLVGQIARTAEWAGEVLAYRMPGSRRRRWEDLERHPEGFVAVGDAVMSFNPIYGQGISVAATEAVLLRDEFSAAGSDISGRAAEVQRRMRDTIDTVFGLVISSDSQYDGAELDGIEPPGPEALAAGRAAGALSVRDAETSLALKHLAHFFSTERLQAASVQQKIRDWMRTQPALEPDDPMTVPGLLSPG